MDKAEYRIGEVIELLAGEYPDLTASTLRFWEREGLLKPSGATEGGQRLYTEDDVNKIRTIKELTKSGVSLSAIKTWFHEHGSKLSDDPILSPFFAEIIPWTVQYFRRRNELHGETEKFLSLNAAHQHEPIYSRKLLLKSMGTVSLVPKMATVFGKSRAGELAVLRKQAMLVEDSAIEEEKEKLLSGLERLKLVRPRREREGFLYSEADRLLLATAFFLGKGQGSFLHIDETLIFFEALGIYPELPWKDERGRICLENVLFNLTVRRAIEQSQRSYLKILARAKGEDLSGDTKQQSKLGALAQLLKEI